MTDTPRSTVPMVPAPFNDTRIVGEEPWVSYISEGDIGEDLLLTAVFHMGLAATAEIDEVRPAGSVAVKVG